jgi:methionyl-tRNA formyltransferase
LAARLVFATPYLGESLRVAILTSLEKGFASLCLPSLCQAPGIEVVLVIQSKNQVVDRRKSSRRVLRKIRQIGVLGALNGVRLRSWYGSALDTMDLCPIGELCRESEIQFETTPTVNCKTTRKLLRAAKADIGLSLGNGYIGRKVFSTPKWGMINVHHELLPQFQGAASVIWQIHEGSVSTGYSVHQIDDSIDTGRILYREAMEIQLMPSLRETTVHNCCRLYSASMNGLVRVITDYPELSMSAVSQEAGPRYTTPSFRQYLHMERQHRRLRRDAAGDKPKRNPPTSVEGSSISESVAGVGSV